MTSMGVQTFNFKKHSHTEHVCNLSSFLTVRSRFDFSRIWSSIALAMAPLTCWKKLGGLLKSWLERCGSEQSLMHVDALASASSLETGLSPAPNQSESMWRP